ncbi:hypothetical protein SLS54_000002 [Diplodia seriata]
MVTVAASASQISFYMTTGGEVQWMAAGNLAADPGGLRMLLSELPKFFITIGAFLLVSWLIAPRFDAATSHVCQHISLSFRKIYLRLRGLPNDYQPLDDSSDKSTSARKAMPSLRKSAASCVTVLTVVITVLILQTVRPRNPPYAHMSGSLPVTLFESLFFSPINPEFCLPYPTHHVDFPFEQYAKVSSYTPPADWKPLTDECRHRDGPPSPIHHIAFEEAAHSIPTRRDHEHGPPPPPHHEHEHQGGYDPTCDPLKLSNIHSSPLDPLVEEIKKNKPLIKHVLLVTMESTRKDLFPIKKGSAVYNSILSSYGGSNAPASVVEELDKKLNNLTRTAAFLTGESTGFDENDDARVGLGPWTSQFAAGRGGINVQQAVTGSAFTLKSLVTSHCGIDPLPVDFTEEVRARMYAPCFPHIVNLFNKAQQEEESPLPSSAWDAALVQSITDQWDSQYTLDDQMGFSSANVILDTTIEDPASAHYPPTEPRCNYFGYPETESLPYLRDLFANATAHDRRLWASHVTSTTHHPYAVPAAWAAAGNTDTFMSKRRFAGLEDEEFDRYLNTVKYQDRYLDTLMTALNDVGVLNSTLIVLVGDHGLAFTAPDGSKSTFENGHHSNFAIPLTFIHPGLPAVQLQHVQTSPTSILPTVLDILVQTGSLSAPETAVADALLPRYQGQSMARKLAWEARAEYG